MVKFLLLAFVLWSLLFTLRVTQMGGIDPNYRDPGVEFLQPLRDRLSAVSEAILPYPQSGLLSGIVLGDKKGIPYFLNQKFKTTSTAHIVVVSGQNLTILAGFLMGLVYLIGRRFTIPAVFLAVILYSLLTGLQIPVIRAAIMFLLAGLAQLLGREKEGAWVLGITGAGMLLYNPNWLLSISFQLSFLATFGVVVVAPVILDCLKRLPGILKQDLAVTLAAQALVLPVIAYNFGQISLAGVITNLLVLWTVPIIMVTGFISLVVGLVSTFLGQLIGLIPSVLLTYFIYMVEFFAKIPGASMTVGESSVVLWIGYYFILGAGIWILKLRQTTDFHQSS